MLAAVAFYGCATVVFAVSRLLWLSILALAAAGAFDMVSVVIRRGLVQLNTPDEMRGRVSSVESLFVGASSQLGSFESGVAVQLLGPFLGVAAGGVATLASSLFGRGRSRRCGRVTGSQIDARVEARRLAELLRNRDRAGIRVLDGLKHRLGRAVEIAVDFLFVMRREYTAGR